MDTMRATEGCRRRTCSEAAGLDQHIEEPDGAQRSRHAWIRLRSRSIMNNSGQPAIAVPVRLRTTVGAMVAADGLKPYPAYST
jgi:hypothetical protein